MMRIGDVTGEEVSIGAVAWPMGFWKLRGCRL